LTVRAKWTGYDPHIARINRMFIEITVFVAFVVAISAAVVKVYEWRQDVLYGPYIGRRSDQNRKAN
jgi:hypothetical protein